jgi:AraC-like DNA-binding protein
MTPPELIESPPHANGRRREAVPTRLLPGSDEVAFRLAFGGENAETPRPTYRELAPPDHLRGHVVCFWRHGATEQPTTAHVLPDGCVDVVWVDSQPPHVAGPMTVPMTYAIGAGIEILAVRLRPGVAHRLLGVSAHELLDQDVPLHDLWPRHQAARWAAVTEQRDERAMLTALAAAIASRLPALETTDEFVRCAAAWLAAHPLGRLEEMGRLSGLSERQIRRRFNEAIGFGPKKLQRILRLQRLLWLAEQERGSRLPLSRLAFAAGYADQPHMTRELQALTGLTPAKLLAGHRSSAVSDLFKTSPR